MLLAFSDNLKNFVDGLLPALLSILVVFAILAIIMGLLIVINKIKVPTKDSIDEETNDSNEINNNKTIKLEDIKDEDMMVAVLVATIDYRNQTKTDVRLKNVKQIG